MSKTIQSTVRILVSYDYCHFEVSKAIQGFVDEHGTLMHLTNNEIDDARKDCQRLADKAVGQYKMAKEMAAKRTGSSYERMQLEKEVAIIRQNKDEFITPEDKAKVKALEDYQHYNYMDDGEYEIGNE